MRPLRPFSDRPWIIIDPWGFDIIDPVTRDRVGFQPVLRPGEVSPSPPVPTVPGAVVTFTTTGPYVAPPRLLNAQVEVFGDTYESATLSAADIGRSQPVLIGAGVTNFGTLVTTSGEGSCVITETLIAP
jgi:hypothetical protein